MKRYLSEALVRFASSGILQPSTSTVAEQRVDDTVAVEGDRVDAAQPRVERRRFLPRPAARAASTPLGPTIREARSPCARTHSAHRLR